MNNVPVVANDKFAWIRDFVYLAFKAEDAATCCGDLRWRHACGVAKTKPYPVESGPEVFREDLEKIGVGVGGLFKW